MGLGFSMANVRGKRLPMHPSCDLVLALCFLPSTAPGHHVELGSQHRPVIGSAHVSHMLVWCGTSKWSQMDVLEKQGSKGERAENTGLIGTSEPHHVAVPPPRPLAIPGHSFRQYSPAGLVLGPGMLEHSPAVAVPMQVSTVKD